MGPPRIVCFRSGLFQKRAVIGKRRSTVDAALGRGADNGGFDAGCLLGEIGLVLGAGHGQLAAHLLEFLKADF